MWWYGFGFHRQLLDVPLWGWRLNLGLFCLDNWGGGPWCLRFGPWFLRRSHF